MIEYDVTRAKQAIQILVHVSHFDDYVKTLYKNVSRPRALPYKDELEVLNELLIIGRQNIKALENLVEVAAYKRPEPTDKKNEYQREFMAAKRSRDKALCLLEETITGKKLTLEKRRLLLLKQYQRWNAEKEKHLSLCGDISWAERNAVIKDFWYSKDLEIAKAQKEALAKKPTKNKVVPIKTVKPTIVRSALLKAIDKYR